MAVISKHWWEQAKLRWAAKSPDFFKKLRAVFVSIVTIATVLEIAIFYMESKGLFIPNVVKYICTGIVGLGIGGGITSKLPVNKPEDHGITVDPKFPVE